MNIKGNIIISGKMKSERLEEILKSLGHNWSVTIHDDAIELSCNYTVLN